MTLSFVLSCAVSDIRFVACFFEAGLFLHTLTVSRCLPHMSQETDGPRGGLCLLSPLLTTVLTLLL